MTVKSIEIVPFNYQIYHTSAVSVAPPSSHSGASLGGASKKPNENKAAAVAACLPSMETLYGTWK